MVIYNERPLQCRGRFFYQFIAVFQVSDIFETFSLS